MARLLCTNRLSFSSSGVARRNHVLIENIGGYVELSDVHNLNPVSGNDIIAKVGLIETSFTSTPRTNFLKATAGVPQRINV